MDETYEKMIFANNLKHYMEIHDENMIELAKYMGVAKSSVSAWCNGLKIPRMDKIEKLSSHYGITKSMLLEESPLNSSKEKLLNLINIMPDDALDKILDYAELLLLQQKHSSD